MTLVEVDTIALGSPWLSKETVKNIVLTDGDRIRNRTIVLNQTNYALKVNEGFLDGYARIPSFLSTDQNISLFSVMGCVRLQLRMMTRIV